jgi:hypothetical protein
LIHFFRRPQQIDLLTPPCFNNIEKVTAHFKKLRFYKNRLVVRKPATRTATCRASKFFVCSPNFRCFHRFSRFFAAFREKDKTIPPFVD